MLGVGRRSNLQVRDPDPIVNASWMQLPAITARSGTWLRLSAGQSVPTTNAASRISCQACAHRVPLRSDMARSLVDPVAGRLSVRLQEGCEMTSFFSIYHRVCHNAYQPPFISAAKPRITG